MDRSSWEEKLAELENQVQQTQDPGERRNLEDEIQKVQQHLAKEKHDLMSW